MSQETHVCPTCSHRSNIFTARLNAGHVDTLLKFRQAISYHQRNSIHLYKDMDDTRFALTTSQQMNWTKLRFLGLVAKVKQDGQVQRGYWLLTTRGRKFLDGTVSVPATARSMNNELLHDIEPELYVTVSDVVGSKPYFDDGDYWHQSKEPQAIEQAQVTLL